MFSQVTPLALLVVFQTICLRLSARLLRRSQIEWKHAFSFALGLAALLFVLGRASRTIGISIPLPFPIFLGAGAQLLLGGWFFSTRARTSEGQPLGWRRGVEVVALALGLVVATIFVLVLGFELLP